MPSVLYMCWVTAKAETIICTNRLFGYQSTRQRQYCEIG